MPCLAGKIAILAFGVKAKTTPKWKQKKKMVVLLASGGCLWS